MATTIWIDADACPQAVKQVIFKAAMRTKTQTVLVANSWMKLPPQPFLRLEVVDKGADVADQYIVDHCEINDLVITADIPLADLIVKKGVAAINPRGKIYTSQNISEALSMRNFMEDLRGSGQITGGPSSMSQNHVQAFARSFDKVLTKVLS